LDLTVRGSPSKIDLHLFNIFQTAQTEVQVRAPLARMTAPTIHLCRKPSPIRQLNNDRRPYGRPTRRINSGVTRTSFHGGGIQG
jgi:hypothetical protein